MFKRPYAEAAAAIQGAKLVPQRADAFSNDVGVGLVIRTDPAGGAKVARGSAVTVFVSKGPDVVVVPDLTKQTIDVATALAQQAGLTVTVQGAYSPGKKVRRQDWPKGMSVPRGTNVILFF